MHQATSVVSMGPSITVNVVNLCFLGTDELTVTICYNEPDRQIVWTLIAEPGSVAMESDSRLS